MLARIRAAQGDIGFYYKNLMTGQTEAFQADLPLSAASVIKLPMMVEAFRQFELGLLDPDMPVTVQPGDKVPICGVLTLMHDGLTVTVRDLVVLMIVISDNTATNLLMDLLGIDNVNALLDSLGMPRTRLRRKMFDRAAAAKGLTNTITAGEIGHLLERIYWGNIVSPGACEAMLDILKAQQVNGKIPFRFDESLPIAHKTGEDDGITHDVGIVYARQPFIVCFCANHADVPAFERVMQDITWEIANDQ